MRVEFPNKLYVSVGPIAPIPGPIFAKQESEIDIPSIRLKLGSKYSVVNEPNKNNIIKIKKKHPHYGINLH